MATETAEPIIGNSYGINVISTRPGSAGISLPNIQIVIVGDDGESIRTDQEGALMIEQPFPEFTQTL